MDEVQHRPDEAGRAHLVHSGQDLAGEHRGLGISVVHFKVIPRDGTGLLVLENTFHAKGGPPRHLHLNQEEWFYVAEGDFVVEIGSQRLNMQPGDSVLAPRMIPHVWAHVGNGRGRMLIAFSPAGAMEGFFREVTKANAMPPQNPEIWRKYGMELLGPPLAVDASAPVL